MLRNRNMVTFEETDSFVELRGRPSLLLALFRDHLVQQGQQAPRLWRQLQPEDRAQLRDKCRQKIEAYYERCRDD